MIPLYLRMFLSRGTLFFVSNDRSVRFLCALGAASTSRVLNLFHIAANNVDNPEHIQKPLFASPVLNQAFLLKHRTRADDAYLFGGAAPAWRPRSSFRSPH